jgi:hypothetical protein
LPASPLSTADRARLAEASSLIAELGNRLWPDWPGAPFALLLVTDSTEYLMGHPRPTPDFAREVYDSMLRMQIWSRPRVFAPTLLATFPAVGGLPTVVVGTAERTGKSSSGWVLTLLHEHFHQRQYSLPDYYQRSARLDLAAGDSSGGWMLNYPFPYDSAPVQVATREFARALGRALDAGPGTRDRAVAAVIRARTALAKHLTSAENRYFEFQLWQEGIARFIEYKATQLASDGHQPGAAYTALEDYESYKVLAERNRTTLRRELSNIDLGEDRRISFYPIGAALGQLLDLVNPRWQQRYRAEPFEVSSLLRTGD